MDKRSQVPSRLRWRCRRGMQELDVLLTRWLDSCWARADEQRQARFEKLLELEDDVLWSWLNGSERPDEAYASLVDEIREPDRAR